MMRSALFFKFFKLLIQLREFSIQRGGYLANLHIKGSIMGLANLSRNLFCFPAGCTLVQLSLVLNRQFSFPFGKTSCCFDLAKADCCTNLLYQTVSDKEQFTVKT
jgi:hypothetical protein